MSAREYNNEDNLKGINFGNCSKKSDGTTIILDSDTSCELKCKTPEEAPLENGAYYKKDEAKSNQLRCLPNIESLTRGQLNKEDISRYCYEFKPKVKTVGTGASGLIEGADDSVFMFFYPTSIICGVLLMVVVVACVLNRISYVRVQRLVEEKHNL